MLNLQITRRPSNLRSEKRTINFDRSSKRDKSAISVVNTKLSKFFKEGWIADVLRLSSFSLFKFINQSLYSKFILYSDTPYALLLTQFLTPLSSFSWLFKATLAFLQILWPLTHFYQSAIQKNSYDCSSMHTAVMRSNHFFPEPVQLEIPKARGNRQRINSLNDGLQNLPTC